MWNVKCKGAHESVRSIRLYNHQMKMTIKIAPIILKLSIASLLKTVYVSYIIYICKQHSQKVIHRRKKKVALFHFNIIQEITQQRFTHIRILVIHPICIKSTFEARGVCVCVCAVWPVSMLMFVIHYKHIGNTVICYIIWERRSIEPCKMIVNNG